MSCSYFLENRRQLNRLGVDVEEPVMVALFLSCSYFLGNRRDSLTSLEEEAGHAQYSQSVRQWRRGIPTTVGVKREGLPIKETATSGYRWKKKWRERKARSKAVKQQTFSSSSSSSFLLPPFSLDCRTKYTLHPCFRRPVLCY